ncbi:Histone-lysine N-methyltransferase SETMAR [Eumeta japonica]|uniref:Histone-lysine N-methyltransferase SETMAR n=1 Tax=Eumeta variegata TaxID=151549 RepID=A0A4C1Z4G8_EUMVA|nr:Histone-lysine N-methyltransferase SETMAR [Eumeta japonica]
MTILAVTRRQNIELTGHPPYSPDLAPNDFYLLPSVKNKLRGQTFSSHEEAVDALKMHVLEIPQSEWQKCYKIGFSVCKCIDHHGEYFEKQYSGHKQQPPALPMQWLVVFVRISSRIFLIMPNEIRLNTFFVKLFILLIHHETNYNTKESAPERRGRRAVGIQIVYAKRNTKCEHLFLLDCGPRRVHATLHGLLSPAADSVASYRVRADAVQLS